MINDHSYTSLDFKSFVLNESRVFLGQEIGKILTALQEIQEEAKKIGTKNLVRFTDRIVCQIRSLLGGHWSDDDVKFLKPMQKAGVALAKALDTSDNLEEIIGSCVNEIQAILNKMKVPVNTLAVAPKDSGPTPEIPPDNTLEPTDPSVGASSGFEINTQQKPQAPLGMPPLP